MKNGSHPRTLCLRWVNALLLAGCAGGGDAPTTPPRPAAQKVTGVAVTQFPSTFSTEGDTVTLVATVTTSDARPYTGAVTWTSTDPAVASVANGFITALKAGTVAITAGAGSVTSTAASTTVSADTIVVLRIAAPDTVFGAHPVGVGLIATNGHGKPIPVPADARLTSLAADVAQATTTSDGHTVTGVGDGVATVRATAMGVVNQAARPIVVVMPPVRFRLAFTNDYPTVLQRVAHRAAVRWERKFASALPPGPPMTVRAGECARTTDTTFTPGSTIELRFAAGSAPGGSGAVAVGGPCALRAAPSARLAVIGAITLSSDWVAFYTRATTDSNALLNVLTHEIGHVLGLGTLPSVAFLVGVPGDNARFTGANARTRMAAVGGRDTTGGVPIENDGQYSHWRRASIPDEVMNLNVTGTGLIPISAITLGALLDIGYPVSLAAADAYRIP